MIGWDLMMAGSHTHPEFCILAGPNGAGKTTCANLLVPAGVVFLNADEIALGMNAEPGPKRDLAASRILLGRMGRLEAAGRSFAIGANLANRALPIRIRRMSGRGYRVSLVFVWLQSVDLAIDRVMERVRRGGHSVPAETIRRRYRAGISNFLHLYRPIVDTWLFYDNSSHAGPTLVATGGRNGSEDVHLESQWESIKRIGEHHG